MHGIIYLTKPNPTLACRLFDSFLISHPKLILDSEAYPILQLIIADDKLLLETHDLPTVEAVLVRN
jgi:hypothetical protein